MNIPELFVQRWESEQPAFGRVLRAVPGDKLDYRPHERSTRAGDLAWQLAVEQRVLSEMLERGECRWPTDPRPETIGQIVEAWDKSTEALRQRLRALDESRYAGTSTLVMEGAPPWNDTIGNMLWGFLFDMVHHRGQLSSYLRPMGGRVPAIYGPSADDSGS